jgi:hypothetical protein
MATEHEGRRIRFESTVRFGDLLVVVCMLIGGLGAWFSLKGQVDQNEAVQRMRDQSQDAAMADFKSRVSDNIVQIHQEVTETRQDVKELARYVRKGG